MYEEETRFAEQNICNLAYGKYDSNNEYNIPDMLECHIDNLKDIPIQGFNFALTDKHPEGKGVHFFIHDYQFERIWQRPIRYAEVLKKFEFCLTPTFSLYGDMPKALKIYNVYRNRWCGRFWQDFGIRAIPALVWTYQEDLDYCLLGIPKHSTIAISTMGWGRWDGYKELYRAWDRIIDTLEPETILLYGKDLSANLPGNIVYKQYITSKVAL